MNSTIRRRAYERHAWVLLIIGACIWLLIGLVNLAGSAPNPGAGQGYPTQATDYLTQEYQVIGAFMILIALFQISVGVKAFRRGERWAWMACASVPAAALVNAYLDTTVGVPASGAVGIFFAFGGLQLIAVVLTIRTVLTHG